MIQYRPHITRAALRAEPDKLFVFGDNLARRGLGGQAAAMRGEPNAVGIPTKKSPSMSEAAFFTDADFNVFMSAAAKDIARLRDSDGVIVWPLDGIGTGLAELPQRAPRIWGVIEGVRRELENRLVPAAFIL